MAAYQNPNYGNPGAQGVSGGVGSTRKKLKKPEQGELYSNPNVAGGAIVGSGQGAAGGGAAGTQWTPDQPFVQDQSAANPGGKNVEEWDNHVPGSGIPGGVSGKNDQAIQYPNEEYDGPGASGLDEGSIEGNDQLLLDNIATLLGEGPRDTAEMEDQIRAEQDRILQEQLGRLMAQAGAGGMGMSGQLGYGMGDAARGAAMDTNRLVLDAQSQAEKDWLDRINTAQNLYGTDLELRSMEDYQEWMTKLLEEGEVDPDDPGQENNDDFNAFEEPADFESHDQALQSRLDDQAILDVTGGETPGWQGNVNPPANARNVETINVDGMPITIWQDPTTGQWFASGGGVGGGPGGYGWLPSPQGTQASMDAALSLLGDE